MLKLFGSKPVVVAPTPPSSSEWDVDVAIYASLAIVLLVGGLFVYLFLTPAEPASKASKASKRAAEPSDKLSVAPVPAQADSVPAEKTKAVSVEPFATPPTVAKIYAPNIYPSPPVATTVPASTAKPVVPPAVPNTSLPTWWNESNRILSAGATTPATDVPAAPAESPTTRRGSLQKVLTGLGQIFSGKAAVEQDATTARPDDARGELPAWWSGMPAAPAGAAAPAAPPTNPHVAFFGGATSSTNPHMQFAVSKPAPQGEAAGVTAAPSSATTSAELPSWWTGAAAAGGAASPPKKAAPAPAAVAAATPVNKSSGAAPVGVTYSKPTKKPGPIKQLSMKVRKSFSKKKD